MAQTPCLTAACCLRCGASAPQVGKQCLALLTGKHRHANRGTQLPLLPVPAAQVALPMVALPRCKAAYPDQTWQAQLCAGEDVGLLSERGSCTCAHTLQCRVGQPTIRLMLLLPPRQACDSLHLRSPASSRILGASTHVQVTQRKQTRVKGTAGGRCSSKG